MPRISESKHPTTPIILKVSVPGYKIIHVETSDGYIYTADLFPLSHVFCFLKDFTERSKISIDSGGLALMWSCRFEMHVDQILSLAILREPWVQASDLRSAV